MTTLTLYIAGSISDGGTLPIEIQFQRRSAFDDAEAELKSIGYNVLNPMRHGVDENKTWLDYMRDSLIDISKADGIAVLDGWDRSRGARLEVKLADDLGIPVKTVAIWTRGL